MRRTIGGGRIRARSLVVAAVLAVLATSCVPKAGTIPLDATPQPSGCITSVGPADKLVVAGCGGDVTYNVSVPATCSDFACGLIVDVHGFTMSGDIQERSTRIAAIGREAGYIVIQPNAPGSPPSWSSSHYPFVAAFVELAIDVWQVDARRVHITGFSQGGAMTFWMRCNRPDLFASAAPSAMSGSACANGANMPTLYVQGLDDIFVGQSAIDATIASFVTRHGLDAQLVIAQDDGYVVTGYGTSTGQQVPAFRTYVHSNTSNGVVGHCIAGAPDPADPYGCDQLTSLSHGRVVVDFFEDHPRAS